MLIPKENEKDLIYSLIFDEYEIFKEIISCNKINFTRIVSIIGFNRIEYFVLNKLNTTYRLNKLPKFFFEHLEKNYFKKSIPTLKIIEKVFLLSDKLKKSDLEHVFLKGISLHDQNSFFIRGMRDIDILINTRDITQVVDLAMSLGFNFVNKDTDLSNSNYIEPPFYDLPLMADGNGVFLEIHFRITKDNINCPLKESIFESKRLAKIHGKNIYVPCHNSLFTHLVFHASKKGNFDVGLIALVDLLQLSDSVDKNEVLRISELIKIKKVSKLFFELIEFSKDRKFLLSKDAENLKEILIFPPLNSKITDIFKEKNTFKKLIKLKEDFLVSELNLKREFGSNRRLPISFYRIKRWTRQTQKLFFASLFILINLNSVIKRARTIKSLLTYRDVK